MLRRNDGARLFDLGSQQGVLNRGQDHVGGQGQSRRLKLETLLIFLRHQRLHRAGVGAEEVRCIGDADLGGGQVVETFAGLRRAGQVRANLGGSAARLPSRWDSKRRAALVPAHWRRVAPHWPPSMVELFFSACATRASKSARMEDRPPLGRNIRAGDQSCGSAMRGLRGRPGGVTATPYPRMAKGPGDDNPVPPHTRSPTRSRECGGVRFKAEFAHLSSSASLAWARASKYSLHGEIECRQDEQRQQRGDRQAADDDRRQARAAHRCPHRLPGKRVACRQRLRLRSIVPAGIAQRRRRLLPHRESRGAPARGGCSRS